MINLTTYPSKVERTLIPSLAKPKSNIRMTFSSSTRINSFVTLLKFTSSTDILDRLFFKAQVINDDDYLVNRDPVTLFRARTITIAAVEECQKWVEQHIDIVDGTNLSNNTLFLDLKITLQILGMNKLIDEYIKSPSIDLAEKVKVFLINEVYTFKDVENAIKGVIERITAIAAQAVGREFKEKNKLSEFHSLIFNTLHFARTSSSNHILNAALLKELADKHHDHKVNVYQNSINPSSYITKIYTIFSSPDLLAGRLFETGVPEKSDKVKGPWNLSDKIMLNSPMESFYVSVTRGVELDSSFAPFDVSDDASIEFKTKKQEETESPFDIEWHTYEIMDAVVWIKTDEDLRSCFIESFIDENGCQRYQKHENNLILDLNQAEFVSLAAQGVLIRFKKRVHK